MPDQQNQLPDPDGSVPPPQGSTPQDSPFASSPSQPTLPAQPPVFGQQYPASSAPYQPTIPGQPAPYQPTIPGQPAPYQSTIPGQPAPYQPTIPGQPVPYGQQSQYNQYNPAYGMAQPGYAGGLVPPVKKKRTALWISLIVIALVLLGGGITVFALPGLLRSSTPTKTLQQYCDGYNKKDAQEIYNTLSTSSQKKTSVAQIQQSLDVMKALGDGSFTITCSVPLSAVSENDGAGTAQGMVNLLINFNLLSMSMTDTETQQITLVLENNVWKIDASTIVTTQGTPTIVTPTP